MFAKLELAAVSRPTQKLGFAALLLLPVINAADALTVTSTFGVQITVT